MPAISPAAAIILAAGFSRRLGRPKQLVVLAGEPLVVHAARIACEAGLDPVLVVVQDMLFASAPEVLASLHALGCRVAINNRAAEGMASSVRCGVEALCDQTLPGAVLMTCDQVAVTPAHLRVLCADPQVVTGSGYAGKTGVPAYFPSSRFPELLTLQGDQGARELLRDARAVQTDALALDVDTEDELNRARSWIQGAPELFLRS